MQKLPMKTKNFRPLILMLGLLSLAGGWQPTGAAPVAAVTTVLPNGLTLVTRVDRTAPRIAISLQARVGAADETAETAGWRRLLTEAMLRAAATGTPGNGATGSSARAVAISQLQREAEAAGGRLGAGVGDDEIEFWAIGDSGSAGHLLDLLLNVVQHPRLSDGDMAVARRRMQTRLDNGADEVSQQAVMALRSRLYRDARGDLTAYGLPENGTDESLQALTAPKLRALWTQYFQPSRFVVAVTGDLNEARLRERLSQLPNSTATTAENEPYFALPGAGQPDLIVRQTAFLAPAAWVFISYNVAGLKDADQPALRVLAAALGESSAARLPQRLLSGRPIPHSPRVSAAQVAIQYTPRRYGSEMIAFAQTDPQNVENVKNAMLDEIRKVRDAPLEDRELQRARNYVLGNWAVEREGLRERAFHTAFAPALGAAPDTDWPRRVAAVTTTDVRRVASKYLQSHAVALILPQQ